MIDTLEALKMQLRESIIQLEQAEKALERDEREYAVAYLCNAKNSILRLGLKLR